MYIYVYMCIYIYILLFSHIRYLTQTVFRTAVTTCIYFHYINIELDTTHIYKYPNPIVKSTPRRHLRTFPIFINLIDKLLREFRGYL